MRVSKKITEKDLEKLAVYADSALYTITYLPPEYLSDNERKKVSDLFLMAHRYFLELTLRAFDDKKLAERLIPLFMRLEPQMIEYTPFFGVLSQLLRLKYGIRVEFPMAASFKEIKSRMERWMQKAPYEEIMAIHEGVRQKEQVERKEEGERAAGEENVMFR